MDKSVRKIVIVGGGSAGWLTAGIIAAEHNGSHSAGIDITLLESADIKPIGVGEGTWPTMRSTLQSIGITEHEFIRCCEASFKQGSQFIGWVDGSEQDNYYHPFMAPHGFGQTDLIQHWQQHHRHVPFAHSMSFQPLLCDYHRAPKQFQTPEYAAVANYGYHLNAAKFAGLLKQHCTGKLGVTHILDDVINICSQEDGAIQAVTTRQHGNIAADLFIDCTGASALLIGKHYNIPLRSQSHILFNDTALAVQVPYQNPNDNIASHTISTAHDAGWIWDIGLPSRRGVGCVFAKDYCSDMEAEKTLLDYLRPSLSKDALSQLSIRKLNFQPGYREKFWHQNCVAVGMSAGFIEPLEASALALIELSAKMIAKELPANQDVMEISAQRFNQRFEYRWQRIIDFLKLHYVLSKRTSAYWQDNRNPSSIPEHLQQLLTLWQFQEPTYNDFIQIEEIFPAASYQYILYGMGFDTQPRPLKRRYNNKELSEKNMHESVKLGNKYLAGLPTNRDLIDHITRNSTKQIQH
ncbi:tryptophan halogenase family protein [Thalassotalea litorea]|uniref:tryptophan halogenase family protein n=1 Tax=Thalassotalea litorea TaxID=2020715 RepID=UPI003735D342